MASGREDLKRLYNIRIIRCYIEYIEKFYQDIDIDEILEFTGLTRVEMADDGYWCTQTQVDRFHQICTALTKNPGIARDAGRQAISTKAYRTMRQYVFGFISPSTAYLLSPQIGSKLSKGAHISVRSLGANSMEMISKPAEGVQEKEYQCQNRIGHIETLAAAFTGKYASVEHPSCFHRGDEECRYIISWAEPLFLKLRRFRNLLLILSILFYGFSLFLLPAHYLMFLISLLLILIAAVTLTGWYSEKEEYRKQVGDQAHTAEMLMLESNVRSNNAKLIQEIGQAISSVLDIDILIDMIMETLRLRLDFDRGAVFLANTAKDLLQYKAGYGFTRDEERFFRNGDIRLDRAEAKGAIVQAFREKNPHIVEDAGKHLDELDWQDQGQLFSSVSSLICVPIAFEEQALGVLYVDRVNIPSPLRQSDLDQLMGIAPQIAISIHNAETYEKMEASELRYRSILKDMEEAYYEVDLDGRFTFFNPSIARTYGYSEDELMGKSYKEFMDEDNIGKVSGIFHQVYVTGETVKGFDWKLRHKNGKEMHVEASVSLRRDSTGNPVGFRGITRDITERMMVEEVIRKSEERYRTIFENSATANILVDEDMTILRANSNFTRMTGYSRQELEGKMSWTSFVVDEDLEMTRKYHSMRRLEPGSAPSSYELRFVNRQGQIGDLFINVAVIPGTKMTVASIIDITERKQAETALKKSEERYRFIADNAHDVIWTFDLNEGFTYLSPSVRHLRGYRAEEAIKHRLDETLSPDSYRKAMELLEEELHLAINGKRHDPDWSKTFDLEQIREDGSTVWTEVTVNMLYDEKGIKGLMGITRDITERKKAEEERKNLEMQLSQAQKMEAIGTLAGGIAHDFNNLLTGVLGNVSLALMNTDEHNPLYVRLKNVEEYVQRGSDLTKQLLGFARGGKYEVKPTHLGEFMLKSSEMFGRTKKEIRMHHKIHGGLWTAEVDRGQMEQVLLNLYVNAWQAMPAGGDLYLSAENAELGEIDVSPYDIKPGRFVKITVTDTGIGMDDTTKARIFEPFFTTKELGRGTGLGLASVYGIIKNHGGFITVESRKGSGTSFEIFLPASDKEIEDTYLPREEVQKGQGTILLIDDEKMILGIGSDMLESMGYHVITATGGREGIQIYEKEQNRISLVILDMIMPDYSGKETFDTLCMLNPSVKVLLSSGYSLDGQANEIMKSGCKGFIQKPFTMAELSKRIREVLDEQ